MPIISPAPMALAEVTSFSLLPSSTVCSVSAGAAALLSAAASAGTLRTNSAISSAAIAANFFMVFM